MVVIRIRFGRQTKWFKKYILFNYHKILRGLSLKGLLHSECKKYSKRFLIGEFLILYNPFVYIYI